MKKNRHTIVIYSSSYVAASTIKVQLPKIIHQLVISKEGIRIYGEVAQEAQVATVDKSPGIVRKQHRFNWATVQI